MTRNGLSSTLDARCPAPPAASPSRTPASAAASAASAVSRRIRRPTPPRARPRPRRARPAGGGARAGAASSESAARPPAVEQLVVVEVDVHDRRQRAGERRARRCRASACSAARARGGRRRGGSTPGCVERGARRAGREERRPRRRSRCSRRTRARRRRSSRSRRCTSRRRRRSAARARARAASAPSRSTCSAGSPPGRPRVRRRRPVRVVAERPERRRLAGALDEQLLVLAVGRRPQQRGDREAAGPRDREVAVAVPDRRVERPFDVARHHRVALRTEHVRDLRTPRQGRARPGAGRADERIDRTSRPRPRLPSRRSAAACSATGASRSSISQTGDQPVANERGDVVAVFNGELYNFRELRARARGEGPRDPRHAATRR